MQLKARREAQAEAARHVSRQLGNPQTLAKRVKEELELAKAAQAVLQPR